MRLFCFKLKDTKSPVIRRGIFLPKSLEKSNCRRGAQLRDAFTSDQSPIRNSPTPRGKSRNHRVYQEDERKRNKQTEPADDHAGSDALVSPDEKSNNDGHKHNQERQNQHETQDRRPEDQYQGHDQDWTEILFT